MNRTLLVLALLALPGSALAAGGTPYFASGSTVLVATTTAANVYSAGGTVTVTSPVKADLTTVGGSLLIDASVAGDALLFGGSINLDAPVVGDVRAVGGRITITDRIGGDLVAIGGSVIDSGGGAANVFAAGGDVALTGGAGGPVTIYANAVSLGGTFTGDVTVSAGDHVTLLPGTVIHGALNYQAPKEATIPASATVVGGVHYTGVSYLPTTEEARAISLASFGVFLFVKILGALILAGLLAGLFPSFVTSVVARAKYTSPRRMLLTLLLGFSVLVATPVFILLLAVTFVGLGLAIILGLAYALLIPLAFMYAATVCGAYLAKYLFKRTELRWSDAVFGMLVLFLIWSLPFVGGSIITLAVIYMAGALTHLMYRFAFPREALIDIDG